ncbi:MAG: TIGR02147 family protein [Bacteriovorax sp.]|nr:TIGR02147 family protein [Bacteriovorax sp.]
MKKLIFDYLDYKIYIQNVIEDSPSKGRGMKLKIAEFLGCQNVLISQVLNGERHFSSEQGARLNKFFEHIKEESHFFLLLINYQKAASDELKLFLREEIKDILNARSDLKNRINIKNSLKKVDQDVYYSSWHYTAIHMMVSIPGLQTALPIARALKITRAKATEVLNFLENTGLVVLKNGKYEIGVMRIHLSKDSPHINHHHTNWRLQALRSIEVNDPDDLHFSTITAISKTDMANIKEILIKAIEESRKVIRDSKEEQVQSICIDFFAV